jgi:protease IV
MSRRLGIFLGLSALFVIGVLLVVIFVLVVSQGDLSRLGSQNSIVVIRVEDVITDAKPILDRIDLYRDRDDIKAFVLRMETPGGSVAASQELAGAVQKLRTDNKVVVTSVANLGASGGYYIASQCDAIVVNPGSLVGSIGVIMEHFEFSELAEKIGVSFDAITSGRMKEIGTATRPMKAEERALIQSVIDDAFRQFRGAVLDGRSDAIAKTLGVEESDSPAIAAALDAVADGRILTGAQAVDVGLADEIGDLEDAIDIARERAGIDDEPNVIIDNPEDPWQELRDVMGLAKVFSSRSPFRALPPSGLWYLYH